MIVIKPSEKEWQEKQGYSKKVFLGEEDLKNKGSLVQQITIKAGDTVKNHYHKKQTEIFYFLKSCNYWIINGKKMSFKTGEILVIEPMDKHEVVNKTKKDHLYLCLKINYDPKDLYWV